MTLDTTYLTGKTHHTPRSPRSKIVAFHRITRLLPIVFLCVLISHAGITDAQTSGSLTTARNPDAVAKIESSLNAMGGAATWASIRTAITAGSLTTPSKVSASAFTWTDDWTAGIKMRRDNMAEDGSHKLFVQGAAIDLPSSPQSASNPVLAKFHLPRFDRVTALILHLPGAALSIVAQDPKYSISTTRPPGLGYFQGAPHRSDAPPPDLRNTSCVLIMRSPQSRGDSAANLSLCFSNATSLPVYAKVMLPNLLDPTKPFSETVEYSGFQSMGAVLVPTAVSITDPLKRRKVLTVNSVSWNSSLPSSASSGVSR